MLDILEIRKHPKEVQENFNRRGYEISVEKLLALDKEKLNLQTDLQELKHKKNLLSKEIASRKKKNLRVNDLLEEIHRIDNKTNQIQCLFETKAKKLQEILIRLPNLLDKDVLEHEEILYKFKEPIEFNYPIKSHLELSKLHNLIDYDRAGNLMGSGYWIYRGLGAKLEWALLNFCLQQNQKAGYEMVMLPPVAREECGFFAGQFPKFRDEVYQIEETEQFLIPTAETLLVSFHQNEILKKSNLPLKYTAYTPCFRKEVSKNNSEKGMIRGHQFNKVEMVQFVTKEESDCAFIGLLEHAKSLMEQFDLHYRVVKLPGSDCSDSMARTYDIEVWLPAEKMYKEVSSISNARTYQSRRSNTRYKDEDGKLHFVHTLNGSGLATSRLFAAILEQNQNEDGSIKIPEVLVPFVGTDIII